jgi:bifunctional DNase/RNase
VVLRNRTERGTTWRRQLHQELPVGRVDEASEAQGPHERAEIGELAAAVRSAIAGLADGQRHAVALFYLQGLTHREVAAELAISVGAVKARLHQARAALASALTPLAPSTNSKEPDMTPTASTTPSWTDVRVSDVRRSEPTEPIGSAHVMVLQELGGTRQLPIWIGPAEAAALALNIEEAETPRPLTYQMISDLLLGANARVSEVRITRLADTVFYAIIILQGSTRETEIDARPSDAVNLARATGAPIRVHSALLENARAADRTDWRDYPIGVTELAAQTRRDISEQIATCTD